MSVIIFFSHIIIAPILYTHIYTFRKHQNLKKLGLSDVSLQIRRKRNVISARFHFLAWLSETLSLIVVIPGAHLPYMIVSKFLKPIIYLFGMKENK